MPTDNPKISAYVPHEVFERFKQFQEERGLSMSQATIEILAEYFEIDLTNSSTKEFTSRLLERVSKLEEELADLKQSYVYLTQKVELVKSTSELLSTQLIETSINTDISNQSNSGTKSELPEIQFSNEEIISATISCSRREPSQSQTSEITEVNSNSEFEGSLLSELAKQNLESSPLNQSIDNPPFELVLESVKTNPSLISLLSKLPSKPSIDSQVNPLKTAEFARRLRLSETMINKIKKYPVDRQINYTKSKDNGRAWVYSLSDKLFYPLKTSE